MSAHNNGGPAFPHPEIHDSSQPYGTPYRHMQAEAGMTLRDYFAAKAMQALITHGYDSSQVGIDAIAAYEIADAMLKERAK